MKEIILKVGRMKFKVIVNDDYSIKFEYSDLRTILTAHNIPCEIEEDGNHTT
jgi:hypothetical protein